MNEDNYPPPSMQELFTDDMHALVRAAHRYISAQRSLKRLGTTSEQMNVERAFEALSEAADQADPWFDDDSPSSMCWVDDRGRP